MLSFAHCGRTTLSVRFAIATLLAIAGLAVETVNPCEFQPDDSVRCEPIQYHECQALPVPNLRINTTYFPNIYNHPTQEVAKQVLESTMLLRLAGLGCSPYTRLLVCSAFYPLCYERQFQRVEPCREMCEDVRQSCLEPYRRATGLREWPNLLRCDRFEHSSVRLCIRNATSCGTVDSASPPTTNTNSNSQPTSISSTCTGHLVPVNNSRSTFAGVASCVEPCEGVYFEEDQEMLINVWTTAISFLSLIVSILVVFTYVLNYKTIQSLQAPIYYISLCYGFLGLTNLISVAVGREGVLCDTTVQNPFNQSILVSEGLTNPVCSTLFSLSYYFTVCTWSWWAVLTLEWMLCSIKSEAFARHWNAMFHALAWGTPLCFLGIALFTGSFSGHPVTQSCWIRKDQEVGFLLVPLAITIFFCSTMSLTVQARIVQLQNAKLRSLRDGSNSESKSVDYIDPSQLVRIGTYISIFVVPMGILFSTYFYDYWFRAEWERSYLLSCASSAGSLQDCDSVPADAKPLSQVYMAQIFASLCMGFVSVFWLLRQQLLLGWKRLCCALCTYSVNQRYDFSVPSATTATDTSAPPAIAAMTMVPMPTSENGSNGSNHHQSQSMANLEPIQITRSSPEGASLEPSLELVQVNRNYHHQRTRYWEPATLEPIRIQMESGTESQV